MGRPSILTARLRIRASQAETLRLGIYDKACPQCTAINVAGTVRCTCGYLFDSDTGDDIGLNFNAAAQEEKLFEEYLAARVAQAEEAARAAAQAAAFEPDDDRLSIAALRAKDEADAAKIELLTQRRRVAQVTMAFERRHNPEHKEKISFASTKKPRNGKRVTRGGVALQSKPKPRDSRQHYRVVAKSILAKPGRKLSAPAKATRTPIRAQVRPAVKRAGGDPSSTPALLPAPAVRRERQSKRRTSRVTRSWRGVIAKSVASGAKSAIKAAAKTARGVAKAAHHIKVGASRGSALVDSGLTGEYADRRQRLTPDATAGAVPRRQQVRDPWARRRRRDVRATGETDTSAKAVQAGAAARSTREPRDRSARAVARRASSPATPSQPSTVAHRASRTVPKQRKTPSTAFRVAQAAKIAKAVEAARELEKVETGTVCPLCTARLPEGASRCRCGWFVPDGARDMPSLSLSTAERAATADNTEPKPIECPACTATLPPTASRCGCGWSPPDETELPSVMLSVDERTAIAEGADIKRYNK
ncbi:MAG: hypothetical protein ACE5K1_04800 [Acidiferrobacterales bacterium]